MPGLSGRPPIIIDIDYGEREGSQRLNVIYPSMPERVSLALVEQTEKSPFWQASEPSASAATPPTRQIGALVSDVPALGTAERAGMDRLLARAVRAAAGTRVALAPARAVRRGQAEGKVTLEDVAAWSLDAQLSTMTVPSAAFLEAVSHDFAGARLWATDGLNAIIRGGGGPASEGADEAEPEPEEGTRTASSDAPASADAEPVETANAVDEKPRPAPLALPAAAFPTAGAKASPASAPEPRPTPPRVNPELETPGAIIASSSLSEAGDPIVVAGWRCVLEDLAARIGIDPSAQSGANGEDDAAASPFWDVQVGQREALIQYLQSGKLTTPPLFPDIRLLPRKAAVRMKWLKQ